MIGPLRQRQSSAVMVFKHLNIITWALGNYSVPKLLKPRTSYVSFVYFYCLELGAAMFLVKTWYYLSTELPAIRRRIAMGMCCALIKQEFV